MWNRPTRIRLGLSLVLGVLAGIALLSLPAFVSPSYQPPGPDTAGRVLSLSNKEASTAEPATGSFLADSNSDKLALAFKLFLILLPGSILSVLARRWATRKLEEYRYN